MRRAKLADARKKAGQSQAEIANVLGVHRTQVSAWERGDATPHPGLRAGLAEALGVTLSELHSYLSSIPVEDESDTPTPLKIVLSVEQAAIEIRAHVLSVVNGLLQTPAYAAGIARAVGTTPVPESYVERNVAQRAHRQQRVFDGHVQLHALQPEASLRSRIGDEATMGSQLRHLAEMAGRPNITIQVIPFSVGQVEAQRIGTFKLNTLPWAAAPTVDLDAYGGARLIDDADEVAYFAAAFDQAARAALSPQASTEFIEQQASEWESRS